MARLSQIVAAIQRQQWLDDLAHRRLETAKLRTLCGFLAASIPMADGENPWLDEATRVSLGTGTEAPDHQDHTAQPAVRDRPETVRAGSPAGPTARVTLADLPDAPPAVRVGQHSPHPAGINAIPLDRLGRMLGGPQ